ncbi:FAD-dependent oxidoreductase [Microbacterium sp. A82]|uniref:FAD-dependent oxidoreductase n=1 Tax=Microbacterium sp. A82 TaxID=3450452 RepID=UPI003F3D0933
MATEPQPTIVIVGMGPVGMTAALSLARRGIAVTVLEAGEDLATESRASTFHPPSLQILSELGVAEELIATGLKAPGFQYRGHNRELIAHLDMGLLSDYTDFPFRIQNEQGTLTRIIRRHLEQMEHVTLRYGAPVERVEMGRDCAYIYLPGDAREASYRADWVIAADGAGSAVRQSLGIAFEGVTYPERFLVASTTHDFLEDFDDLAYVSYVYDPEDWGVLLRTPNHWRVLFPIDEGESDEVALSPDRIEERLQGVIALDEPYPIVHSTIYRVHQRLAATFGQGRVLLAGDAAHINNPLGGMGMNSGIHDAHAAVETIAFALEGGDARRAVDTYARVRYDAAAVDVQKNTQKNYDEMRERDERERSGRKQEMAEIAADVERCRAYLMGASMLASFETSRRRMRRGLSPVRATSSRPAGQALSDAVRGTTLLVASIGDGDGAAVYLPAERVIWSTDDLAEVVESVDKPLIVGVKDVGAAEAIAIAERAGVAVVEFSDADADSMTVATAIATAHGARRDVLVIGTVSSTAGCSVDEIVATGRLYVNAGADFLGLVGLTDPELLHAVHRALPEVPLAISASVAALPSIRQLTLAGVGLALVPSSTDL